MSNPLCNGLWSSKLGFLVIFIFARLSLACVTQVTSSSITRETYYGAIDCMRTTVTVVNKLRKANKRHWYPPNRIL